MSYESFLAWLDTSAPHCELQELQRRETVLLLGLRLGEIKMRYEIRYNSERYPRRSEYPELIVVEGTEEQARWVIRELQQGMLGSDYAYYLRGSDEDEEKRCIACLGEGTTGDSLCSVCTGNGYVPRE